MNYGVLALSAHKHLLPAPEKRNRIITQQSLTESSLTAANAAFTIDFQHHYNTVLQ